MFTYNPDASNIFRSGPRLLSGGNDRRGSECRQRDGSISTFNHQVAYSRGVDDRASRCGNRAIVLLDAHAHASRCAKRGGKPKPEGCAPGKQRLSYKYLCLSLMTDTTEPLIMLGMHRGRSTGMSITVNTERMHTVRACFCPKSPSGVNPAA